MKTGKRKTPKNAWKPGQSGNPKGRPKDGESWSAIIKSVGDMYPTDLIAFIGRDNDLGQMLAQLPANVQMKYLVTARVFSSLMFEPSHGLWKELMERSEGKITDKHEHTGEIVHKAYVGWSPDEWIADDEEQEQSDSTVPAP